MLVAQPATFPLYASPIVNLANQFAGATRPPVIGQLSELIQQFDGRSVAECEVWYESRYPHAIEDATGRLYAKVAELAAVAQQIDRATVERWVRDLVLTKTFAGLRLQQAILKAVADARGASWALSGPVDEARGIDGYLDGRPVTIKPWTYQSMARLTESLPEDITYYEKAADGIVVRFAEPDDGQ